MAAGRGRTLPYDLGYVPPVSGYDVFFGHHFHKLMHSEHVFLIEEKAVGCVDDVYR